MGQTTSRGEEGDWRKGNTHNQLKVGSEIWQGGAVIDQQQGSETGLCQGGGEQQEAKPYPTVNNEYNPQHEEHSLSNLW